MNHSTPGRKEPHTTYLALQRSDYILHEVEVFGQLAKTFHYGMRWPVSSIPDPIW